MYAGLGSPAPRPLPVPYTTPPLKINESIRTENPSRKPNIKNIQSTIPKRGPPPRVPKKVVYKEPLQTKAMQERIKHAQKFREELERKERERAQAQECRRPQRTAAPPGGDARMARAGTRPPASAGPRSRPTSATKQPGPAASSTAAPPGATCPQRAPQKAPARKASAPGPAPAACKSRAASAPASKSARPAQQQQPPPPAREPSPVAAQPVPERTRNLAESMNADIVQAEPLQPGMVDNIIIPPGAINTEKTTIVSIPQPEPPPPAIEQHSTIAAGSGGVATSGANKSMQVINEALDEQDANESAIVNSKLQDLQNARRDFVMAVANVGNNSFNLGDDDFGNIMDITPPDMMVTSSEPGSPMVSQRLIDFSDIDEPCPMDYGSRQPVVESAREYMRSRQSYQPEEVDLLDPEYLEGCGLVGADDFPDQLPVCGPTDNYTIIPRKREQYRYAPGQVEQLERFFDLENYPPCPASAPQRPSGPPPGREHIHPDLWEIDDPWFHEPEGPDLIDWGSYC